MKLGDGLFLNTFRRVAEEYKSTGIEANDMIIDNTCVIPRMPRQMQLLFFSLVLCSSLRSQINLTSW